MNPDRPQDPPKRRPWIGILASVSLIAVIVQFILLSQLRKENQSLRLQASEAAKSQSLAKLPNAASPLTSGTPDQSQQERLELLQLREEIRRFRDQAASSATTVTGATAAAPPPQPDPASPDAGQPPPDEARLLALAAMQGNPGALNQFAALVTSARSLSPEEQARILASIQSAFEMLGRQAGTGNTGGLQALWQASRIPELKAFAVKGLGQAAGLGNEEALEPLLDPERYLLLRSSATAALRPAADAGNDRAIQALAATASDPKQQGLWLLAAQGLEKSAAAGNDTAIDGLAALAAVQNEVVRKQAIFALEAAARENQPRAEEALKKLGWR